ncbi:uncharacterized protein LOC122055700 [Zingiber officinale]|uniref:Uncharacterized protein n=1 Tax=Zingiber officinale TaxID=94328 RepID=A0A8J5H8E0_ZINOF|nr:uncharacterized protein LOC122055700 [Zingiber officinale]KAG6517282.1 hypothetical protein ZIOFF_020667 [Zingiber officinale]
MDAAKCSSPATPPLNPRTASPAPANDDYLRVRRRALEAVLENCRRALELLENPDLDPGISIPESQNPSAPADQGDSSPRRSRSAMDLETDELCSLLKSKVESPNFLEKLGNIQSSVSQNIQDDNASWNIITATDSWEDNHIDGDNGTDEDYVLVSQEDIVDSIASFMAAYLLSLKQTKELSPNQLQEALCKAFSVKKRKSRLWKAWEGSQVIYNVASWGATAIGIYQNPAILKAATVAFWSSCRVISKLL